MNAPRPRLTLIFMLLGAACSSSSATGEAAGDSGAGTTKDTGADVDDASGGSTGSTTDADIDAPSSTATDAGDAMTWLRVMNLSPDAPALDFCAAPEGGTFVGPLSGTSAGVIYEQASPYAALAPDYYDVRLVVAGSKDCTVAVGNFAASLSTLGPGQHTTLIAAGDLTPAGGDASFTTAAYTDGVASSASGFALRFVNASSDLTHVDFGTGSLGASDFVPLLIGTPFTGLGSPFDPDAGALDANGYVLLAPQPALELSVHATNDTHDAVVADPVATTKGAVATVFLVGGKSHDAGHPDELVLCNDAASVATSGSPTSCTRLSH